MPRLRAQELMQAPAAEPSAVVAQRVWAARARCRQRTGRIAAELDGEALHRACPLSTEARRILEQATEALGLSPRGHVRLLRVARTIADLAGYETIEAGPVAEAVGLRRALS
ncbi:MAG: hypothetical protein ACOC1T_03830 [Halorhodospira sp.]